MMTKDDLRLARLGKVSSGEGTESMKVPREECVGLFQELEDLMRLENLRALETRLLMAGRGQIMLDLVDHGEELHF